MSNAEYDVIVLGSGIGGSTLAAILARNGFSALMIEKSQHPRFALGESTLPQTSYWMWLISERYGIPELKNLADAHTVASMIAPTSGIKRSIGFAYHHEGQPHDMLHESHQLLAPELPFISESHFYREDIDLYMVKVAQQYGAVLKENTEAVTLEIDDTGVRVQDRDGSTYSARYLIDASGFHSLVSKTFDLRDNPTRLKTQSRAIFTHVDGLRPFDELFAKSQLPGLKYRWHDGTVHHMFDGGWLWTIPFDNHCDSQNTKASVGLMLDMRKFPKRDDITPEQEFKEIVSRFPTIVQHLEKSTAVRPYIGTGRLQFSCKRAVGNRYFITPQAYGSVDALYSRGMISTFETIFTFAQRLLDALRDDDFALERFAGLDDLARRHLDSHDQMVMNAYRAFGNFDAWNGWLKIWVASKLYGDIWLMRTCMKYMSTGDRALLDNLDLSTPPFAQRVQHMVDLSSRVLEEAEAGRIPWKEAGDAMIGALRDCDWLPNNAYAWGDADVHHGDFTPPYRMPLVILWGKLRAPQWVRQELFDFPPMPLVKMQMMKQMQKIRPHLSGREAQTVAVGSAQ